MATVQFDVKWRHTEEIVASIRLHDLTELEVSVFQRVLERNGCTTFKAMRTTDKVPIASLANSTWVDDGGQHG